MKPIKLKEVGYELRVDSRIISKHLGVDHKATIQLIDKYESQLNRFGQVTFKMGPNKQGSKTRYTLLNRSQAELLLSLSRNTPETVELKVQLIMAFDKARSTLEASNSYIPFYHQAHDSLQALVDKSGSSTAPAIHHINLEKLINKHFGLCAGTRNELPAEIKLMISAAMALSDRIYKQTLANNQNHKQGYKNLKEALEHHLYLAPTQLKGAPL